MFLGCMGWSKIMEERYLREAEGVVGCRTAGEDVWG